MKMKLAEVTHKKEEKQFLRFRKDLYRRNKAYIDNSYFMIREVFRKHTSFIDGKEIYPFNVIREGRIVSQGIVIFARELPDYIQLSFLESLPGQGEAVKLLADKAAEIGRQKGCRKLVVGLNGHVNYGLGLLSSCYDTVNSFSGAANPEYYHAYLKSMDFTEIRMKTYVIRTIDGRLEKCVFVALGGCERDVEQTGDAAEAVDVAVCVSLGGGGSGRGGADAVEHLSGHVGGELLELGARDDYYLIVGHGWRCGLFDSGDVCKFVA